MFTTRILLPLRFFGGVRAAWSSASSCCGGGGDGGGAAAGDGVVPVAAADLVTRLSGTTGVSEPSSLLRLDFAMCAAILPPGSSLSCHNSHLLHRYPTEVTQTIIATLPSQTHEIHHESVTGDSVSFRKV